MYLGIKDVSLSNQRRFKDVQGCLWCVVDRWFSCRKGNPMW